MTDTTSSGSGATPISDPQPATGNAPSSATLQKPAVTLEEALAQLAELRHAHENAEGELKRHRNKLTAYEKAEAERTAAKQAEEDAKLDELTRTSKQLTELQAQHDTYTRQMQERVVRYEVELQAAKLGIIDPEAATKLLNYSELEYEEDGTPKNAVKLLQALIKNKPYLAPPKPAESTSEPNAPATPAQTVQRATPPPVPAMNPGRSQIAPPATTPGKIPSWNDIYGRK